jgi:TonB family protein
MLLATLREASQPIHNLLHAETPESAVDLLIGGHCGILIIDLAVARDAPVELIEKLHAQFPEVLLLATGRRNEQQQVTGLVGSGRIYRFLHKPVSPARAEAFLNAATRRYSESHPRHGRTQASAAAFANSPRRTYGLIGAALTIALAGGWWWSSTLRDPASPPMSEASPERELDELLARADAARAAGTLTMESGEGAIELYRAALAIDAENERAHRGIADIVVLSERNMREALAARDAPRAREAFAALQKAEPGHPQLNELQTALLTLSRGTSQTAARSTSERPVAPATPARAATPNLDLARAFINANQLADPPDASALGALRAARDANEDESRLQIAATDLGTRLIHRALAALEAGDIDTARSDYSAAAVVDLEFETALPDIELVARKIHEAEIARDAAALAELVARASLLRRQDRLTGPDDDNAMQVLQAAIAMNADADIVKEERQRLASALLENTRTTLAAGDIDRADVLATRAEEVWPGLPQTRALREQIGAARSQRDASTVLQATTLPRTKQVPAAYPREALLGAIEGWVDLEFTISPEGVPTQIGVKASHPPRTFDASAIQALRQWRFEPIVRDGEPQARRAALRMEFKLKD